MNGHGITAGIRTRSACVACVACLVCVSGVRAQAPRTPAPVGVTRESANIAFILGAPALGAPAARISGGTREPLFQAASDERSRPPLEPARIAGQMLAGAYSGMGGYIVGSWAGSLLMRGISMASDDTKDKVSFAFGVAGATWATAASVSAIGNIGDQTGSYPTALVGTVSGVAVGLLLNQLLYGHARLPAEEGSSKVRWIEASLEALLPSIGATIAFNSSRRYK